MVMRLRQIALAARDLETPLAALAETFGLKVGYIDRRVGHYGIRNAVLPMGCGFLEIVQPMREDASVARFLDRIGGDAGYMLILQTDDAVGEARRVQELGVRVVEKTEGRAYRFFHFHPSDFGGVLTSFDEVRVGGDMLEEHSEWPAAGREWRAARTDFVRDIVSVTLTGPDPYSLATRWSELLGRKLAVPGRLRLDRGEILFAQGGDRARIAEITLAVADPARVPAEGVLIGGVRFRAVR